MPAAAGSSTVCLRVSDGGPVRSVAAAAARHRKSLSTLASWLATAMVQG
jgi:hypothetical protein